MAKQFIDENFLLANETAKHLFHTYAKTLPIIDYHNHLSAQEINEDIHFSSITEAWLGHDHYKWRAMRTNGVEEQFITGDASERDKFEKWCASMPYLLGNPLLHWTHLELQRYFDIDLVINEKNASAIWEECNKKLATPAYSARNLLRRMNVESLCTTDDPLSDLEHHKALAEEGFEVKVLPTFRADDLFYIENNNKFLNWVKRLGDKTQSDIQSIHSLFKAIEQRFDYFHSNGCRLSDIGIKVVPYAQSSVEQADTVFRKVLAGENINQNEIDIFKTQIFHFLGVKNKQFGWTMQLHIGVLQDPNQRRFEEIGPATGMSAMDDQPIAKNLARLLSDLDYERNLTKTIIYCLNPRDNAVVASLIGGFQDSDSVPGKIQFGSAWWFNDQKDGMLNQIKMLGNMGMLGRFIGMLTDSRSLLSMPRHEYFRRILCNLIGQWVEEGEVPDDQVMLKEMVEGICYYNAKRYFNL
ncbi:glucuronate isomerase [Psychromonas algicola]|uniref:glucuronate isomerase n=1 Tax=Psychromonas algicola TaxID=2555642 RepID=UPI001067CF5F|nr:glucuronate isomerase [Psychromonas sp. RZ5]TEW50615.1 glucuronate isomerase [Psychromonas sp. RZ5]